MLVQMMLISTVIALVFVVRDAVDVGGPRPGDLIWLLISFTAWVGSAAGLATVWIGRKKRVQWEKERNGKEVEKWKREVRRMAREMSLLRGQAGRLRGSLRDVSWGVSREWSASGEESVSRGRRRRKGEKNRDVGGGEVDVKRHGDDMSRTSAGREGHDVAWAGDTEELPSPSKEDPLTDHTATVSAPLEPGPIPGTPFPHPALSPHPSIVALTNYIDAEIQRRSNPQLNRMSTWTHHLDLEPDDDDDAQASEHNNANHKVDDGSSPPHYLFPYPSFPSFNLNQAQPGDVDGITTNHSIQSNANFLAANVAASDAVSDDSTMAALRRGRSSEKVGKWEDGWALRPVAQDVQRKEKGKETWVEGARRGLREEMRRWGRRSGSGSGKREG